MQYMLDTNICIFILRNKTSTSLREKLLSVNLSKVAISVITVAELEVGVQKSRDIQAAETKLQLFLTPFTILPFETKDTLVYAKVRADLERQGTPIGPLDNLIAAHSLSNNLIMVTNNSKEFSLVDNLRVEDWS